MNIQTPATPKSPIQPPEEVVPSPPNLTTTQSRFLKSCQAFCSKLQKNQSKSFEKLSNLLQTYKTNHIPKLETLEQIISIFKGDNNVINDLNRLLHEDARVPVYTTIQQQENHQQRILLETIKLINQEKPDKFQDFQKLCNQLHTATTPPFQQLKIVYNWCKTEFSDCPHFLINLQNSLGETLKNEEYSKNQIPNENQPQKTSNNNNNNNNSNLINNNIPSISNNNKHNNNNNNHKNRQQEQQTYGQKNQKNSDQRGIKNHRRPKQDRKNSNSNNHTVNNINRQEKQNFNLNHPNHINAGPITLLQTSRYHHILENDNIRDLDDFPGIQQQQQNSLDPSQIYSTIATTKSDNLYFGLLQMNLPPHLYSEVIQILNLYTQSIISCSEFLQLTTSAIKTINKEEYVVFMRNLVESREVQRRRASQLFKPLNDMDFTKSQRTTHSYVDMPISYPKRCQTSNALSKTVLNTEVVSVPHGSEHVSFNIMRQNCYEDALFQSEDEKYEFDLNISMFQMVLKYIDKVNETEDETVKKGLLGKVLEMKIVQKIYKNDSEEQKTLVEMMEKVPQYCDFIRSSVKLKLDEVTDAREKYIKKVWQQTAEKNFHKSLDHRSFYFKKNDKKYTASSRLERQPYFRFQLLTNARINEIDNKQDFEQNIEKFNQILNSFEGLTKTEKCDHNLIQNQVIEFDYQNQLVKHNLPIFVLSFNEKEMAEEAFSLLVYHIQSYGTNQGEREKIQNTSIAILEGIFGFHYQVYQPIDIISKEAQLLQELGRIETMLFDYTFLSTSSIISEQNQINENSKIQQIQEGVGDIPLQEQFNNNIKQEENQCIIHNNQKENLNNQQKDLSFQKIDVKEEESVKMEGNLEQENFEEEKNKLDCGNEQEEEGGRDAKEEINNDQKIQQEDENIVQNQEGNFSKNSTNKQNISHSQQQIILKKETLSRSENNNSKQDNTIIIEEEIQNTNSFALSDLRSPSFFLASIEQQQFQLAKEMSFISEIASELNWLPKQLDNSQIFFSTKFFYIFIRNFYNFYERICKAKEISKSFEVNKKTAQLTQGEKETLQTKRFEAFKSTMLIVLQIKGDTAKYEDYFRSIFGKQAYLLFTIDKLVTATCQSLQGIATHEGSNMLLNSMQNLIIEKEEIAYIKSVYIAKTCATGWNNGNSEKNQIDRSLFRLNYDFENRILYLNYFEVPEKHWEKSQIDEFQSYLKCSFIKNDKILLKNSGDEGGSVVSQIWQNRVFLERNCNREDEIKLDRMQSVYLENNIQYSDVPDNFQLNSRRSCKQDVLVSKKKKQAGREMGETRILKIIQREIRQVSQFYKWLNQNLS